MIISGGCEYCEMAVLTRFKSGLLHRLQLSRMLVIFSHPFQLLNLNHPFLLLNFVHSFLWLNFRHKLLLLKLNL